MSFTVFWITIYGYCNEVILLGIYRNFSEKKLHRAYSYIITCLHQHAIDIMYVINFCCITAVMSQ